MCIILFSYKTHPKYRLIVAANRDEFYRRPTAPAAFWPDHPDILAGRDLEQMGTWMGITKSGRFAALTNYRDPASRKEHAKSRGHLVSGFLCGIETPAEYLRQVQGESEQYEGFNLLVADQHHLLYFSAKHRRIEEIAPGIHGLSNADLNTPWPKVQKGKKGMRDCLSKPEWDPACFFQLLADSERAADHELPDTGVGIERERILSPIFIASGNYGTRSSTVLTVDVHNRVRFVERTYNGDRKTWSEANYSFSIRRKIK